MRCIGVSMLALLLFLGMVLSAAADTLHMKNGKQLEGRLISQENGMIVFETSGMKMNLPESSVEKVERQSKLENLITKADQLDKNGHYAKAYDAYQAILSDPGISPEQHKELCNKSRCILEKAVIEVEKKFIGFIEAKRFQDCIDKSRKFRTSASCDKVDALAYKAFEANMHLQMAYDMLDRSNLVACETQLIAIEALNIPDDHFPEQMGVMYLEIGKHKEASRYLEKAAAQYPDDVGILSCMIDSQVKCQKYDKAIQAYEKIRENGQEFLIQEDTGRNIGLAYRNHARQQLTKGDVILAKAVYSQGMDLSTRDVQTLQEAYAFYVQANDDPMAREIKKELDALIIASNEIQKQRAIDRQKSQAARAERYAETQAAAKAAQAKRDAVSASRSSRISSNRVSRRSSTSSGST
ncbi:MAG: tetratricopeptide repeat protein [Candidatus Sumerlaeia bacterium]